MMVVDLSDSMNEDDGTGTIKLDGAKSALKEVSRQIAPGAEVGLWTFPGSGKNSRDGCSLGDATFALGALDPTRIDAEVDALTADGDTPTGPALQAAIDHMKAAGRTSGLVILVSDGLSNCGTPPCDVARQARADGFDITAAVAGFQVSAEGRQELECIANTTGGVYVDAGDSGELGKAVSGFVGIGLDVKTQGLNATLSSGMRQEVTVTVTNTSQSQTAQGLSATLAFGNADGLPAVANTGAGAYTVFPAVLPPRAQLGNLPPGTSLSYTWSVAVPTVSTQSVAAPRITLQSRTGLPLYEEGKWNISSKDLTLANAGPLLRDATSVLILGDSYSSGEGTFDYLTGAATARDSCHRSLLTYGLVLFAPGGRLGDDDGKAIVACSGAVTQNYFHFQGDEAVPPQRDQLDSILDLPDGGPDVALMTFGGNDIGFADVVSTCALDGDCTTFPYPEKGDPNALINCLQDPECSIDDVKPDSVRSMVSVRFEQAEAVSGQLAELYVDVATQLNTDRLRAARGGAWTPLVVLPYPQVLAPNSSCSNFNANERDFGIRLGHALNQSVKEAVDEAVGRGLPVYYAADVANAVVPDHTACAGDGKRWINPVNIVDGIYLGFKEQMHPNAQGYAAMTTALVQWSRNAEVLPGPFTVPPDAQLEPGWPSRIAANLQNVTAANNAVALDMAAPPTEGPRQVAPGQLLRVSAAGLAPNSPVRVVMRSTPVTLGVLMADGSGLVDGEVTAPADAARGDHQVLVDGFDADGAPVVLAQPISIVTPIAWWIWGIIVLSAVALAAGWALIWRSRSRG